MGCVGNTSLTALWKVLGAFFVSCYAVSAKSAWKPMKLKSFLQQGLVGLPGTGLDGLAYVVF